MSQQSLARECAQTTPGGQGGDQALPHGMPVQLSENWRDADASPSARHQPSILD